MRYTKVSLDALAYELAPNVITSSELEKRVEPVYQALRMPLGQLEALTGIRERRWWDAGFKLSEGASRAGRKALAQSGVKAQDLGVLIYTGVCRESSEPATACAVANQLGVCRDCAVYDLSNACLGVLSGIVDISNRIELGHIKAGLVVLYRSIFDVVRDFLVASHDESLIAQAADAAEKAGEKSAVRPSPRGKDFPDSSAWTHRPGRRVEWLFS